MTEATQSYPETTEPVAWMVERQCDPTFPRLFMSHRDATALLDYCNVSPRPTLRPLYLAVAQAAWQPIETNPKAWRQRFIGTDGKQLTLCMWTGKDWAIIDSDNFETINLTHWMPLPAGPSVSSTDPRCTCAAVVNPNIPHARSCPLSSPSHNTMEGE